MRRNAVWSKQSRGDDEGMEQKVTHEPEGKADGPRDFFLEGRHSTPLTHRRKDGPVLNKSPALPWDPEQSIPSPSASGLTYKTKVRGEGWIGSWESADANYYIEEWINKVLL